MKLEDIKSAEIIDDPIKIFNHLQDAREQTPGDTTTTIRDDDGRARVDKRGASAILTDAPPLPDAATMRSLAEAVGLEWTDELASRAVPYIASDQRVDRHGDIVRQNWKFENFAKNPIVPYGHDWDMPPVGNSIQWNVIDYKSQDYTGPALYLLNVFATKEMWAWADTVFRLVKAGFLKSSSVGFYPGVIIDVKDQTEREQLGLGKYGWILDQNELIEHSVVSVPANAGAVSLLRSAKSKGLVEPQDVFAIRELMRQDVGSAKEWQKHDSRWRTAWGAIFPEMEIPEHKDYDVPITLEALEKSNQLTELFDEIETLRSVVKTQDERLTEALDDIALSAEIRRLTGEPEQKEGLYDELFGKDHIPTLEGVNNGND